LDLQLPMQSVPITIDVVSSNLDQGEVVQQTDCHDIAEILLKVALNTNKQTNLSDQISDALR